MTSRGEHNRSSATGQSVHCTRHLNHAIVLAKVTPARVLVLARLIATRTSPALNVTTPIDSATSTALPLSLDAWIAGRRDPVLLIDPNQHRLVASNAAGADRLGIPSGRSLDLDPAMPGWGPIKALLTADPDHAPTTTTILFWTPAGPVAVSGRLEVVRHDQRSLVLITLDQDVNAITAAPSPAAPNPENNDLATLRDIARRIRAGTAAMALEQRAASDAVAAEEAGSTSTPSKPPSDPESPKVAFPPPLNFQLQPIETNRDAATRPTSTAERPMVEVLSQAAPRADAPTALAKLAHELRTPLSAIVSLSEVMRDEQLGGMGNPRYKAYASDIHESARHTLDLVQAMVDAEHRTSPDARLHLDRISVDLNEIARSCGSAMQPIASRSSVVIDLALDSKTPPLLANGRAIRQMIFNLLSNALRYTPSGGRITISTKPLDDNTVRLDIENTGKGIDPAEIERVLASLPQTTASGNSSSDVRHNGRITGIGLPLVRQLAEAHDAILSIDTDPISGTRIGITFPLDRIVVT